MGICSLHKELYISQNVLNLRYKIASPIYPSGAQYQNAVSALQFFMYSYFWYDCFEKNYSAMQIEKTVAAYFSSKQLQLFRFGEQHGDKSDISTKIVYLWNMQLQK